MFIVYVLVNTGSGKLYIGQTSNLHLRLKRHNRQLPVKTKSYTFKNKGNWKVVYQEKYNTRKEAIQREKGLKSYQGRMFLKKEIRARSSMAERLPLKQKVERSTRSGLTW